MAHKAGASAMRLLNLLCVASLLGCAPVLGGAGGFGFLGAVFLLSASLVFVLPVFAPSPSDAGVQIAQWTAKRCTQYRACKEGVMTMAERCCPKGRRCNYRMQKYLECGDDSCVTGYGATCPPDVSQIEKEQCVEAGKKGKTSSLKARWRVICDPATNKLVKACAGVGSYPTNYSGPRVPIWRPFLACGKDTCVSGDDPQGCASLNKEKGEEDVKK